jgi:hypothetical protein
VIRNSAYIPRERSSSKGSERDYKNDTTEADDNMIEVDTDDVGNGER